MGEDYASDGTWRMVLSKSNNAWRSTIKTEQIEEVIVSDDTDDNLIDESYSNLKNEPECNVHTEDVYDVSDDMLIEVPKRGKKRNGSGSRSETEEERTMRLAKMSAYAAQRLANETPEQRALRLKRMSEYAARRLATETPEQRARRLARMSAYAAKRLSQETPEQRKARLARMSAYAAKKQANKWKTSPTYTEAYVDKQQNVNNDDKSNQS